VFDGGNDIESFDLIAKDNFDHGETVSSLISANHALGITNGIVEIGDRNKSIVVNFDKSKASLIGLVSYRLIRGLPFARLSLSMREVDDTSRSEPLGPIDIIIEFSVTYFYNSMKKSCS
jgi:hypothetical protein